MRHISGNYFSTKSIYSELSPLLDLAYFALLLPFSTIYLNKKGEYENVT